jgi:tetratricopeptide (TPR) repeat protein
MTAPRAIASLAAVVAVAAFLAPSPASADPAAAEALFREGRRLLDDGKTEEACSKLAESQAQDPSSGTLLNLGWCHEIQHKLATAWSDYVSAARLAREQGRPDRAVVADKKATDLEPRLPHLTVTAIAPAVGLQIERGDERIGLGLLGSAVPLDPGSYVITARAPGHRSWKTTIDVAEAESKTVQVPGLEAEAPAPAEAPETPLGPPAIAVLPPDGVLNAASSQASHGHTFGWIIGGVGVAGLAVGAVAGIASLISYHDATTLCPSRSGCGDAAISARNSAESKAWVSNIAFGVGVVGVGIGSFVLLTGRRSGPSTSVAVRAAPDATGMRVSLEQSF